MGEFYEKVPFDVPPLFNSHSGVKHDEVHHRCTIAAPSLHHRCTIALHHHRVCGSSMVLTLSDEEIIHPVRNERE